MDVQPAIPAPSDAPSPRDAGFPGVTPDIWRFEMALSLPGERSVAAGSSARPLGAILGWIANAKRNRDRRVALHTLLELDCARLRDLGISHRDIAEAL